MFCPSYRTWHHEQPWSPPTPFHLYMSGGEWWFWKPMARRLWSWECSGGVGKLIRECMARFAFGNPVGSRRRGMDKTGDGCKVGLWRISRWAEVGGEWLHGAEGGTLKKPVPITWGLFREISILSADICTRSNSNPGGGDKSSEFTTTSRTFGSASSFICVQFLVQKYSLSTVSVF